MEQYILAFFTGLTAGGLSCMAVQGGLLATALERRVEKKIAGRHKAPAESPSALPIALFLAAKLVAYTLLGFFLGVLGSVFQLSFFTRALLMVAIGIFMVGNGLRMLNVHPIFRYFVIEPPRFITRSIRKTAKEDTWSTPVFLGALTVLIPCGVTQSIMALAIASGDPIQGMMLLFSFTLGASPVFFVLSFMATKLGQRAEGVFSRVVAVVVLLVGLSSIDSAANLMGLPSVSRAIQMNSQPAVSETAPLQPIASLPDTLTLEARDNGYFPAKLAAPAGVPVKLNVVTDNTYSCSRAFVIPDLNIETILPETGTVPIEIPAQKAGYKMYFTCSMGMYTGMIEFK